MRLPKFLSRATVADELGISIKTVDRWIERGLIPAKRPPGTRRVMIPENALAELLSQAKWDVR
jgi:excisionase family DNA binding protein